MSGFYTYPDFPGASYDNWKTTPPDWDEEPDDEPEDRLYVHQRRHTLQQESARAIEGNPAALAARELTRAAENTRNVSKKRVAQRDSAIEREKGWARTSLALAKRLRTFIGPPCPDDMIPF